ncbi:hypothetical protein EV361DRAFT_887499 [Lentinula raphanica]|nr:hypothetical protein EV361DRAFT_887499 [Lentinula raphanica]
MRICRLTGFFGLLAYCSSFSCPTFSFIEDSLPSPQHHKSLTSLSPVRSSDTVLVAPSLSLFFVHDTNHLACNGH